MHASNRRRFLVTTGAYGVASIVAANQVLGDSIPTPAQTMGPYYPKPPILEQPFYDADLTRKDKDSPVAEGEIIVVEGQIVDIHGNPIAKSVVEVWQASSAGKYNHPGDTNQVPLDPNFQYWAHILTDDEGKYSYKTILPGKYPGRTPHIHYRIQAKGHKELVTQMYFESKGSDNSKDGIYKGLTKPQQESVTVAFAKSKEHDNLPIGKFQIVLGPREASNSTPPM